MKQKNIPDLPEISFFRYENFFNLYQLQDGNYFYNLLASVNIFPATDSSLEDAHIVKPQETWVYLSYKYYNTMDLWWLVCAYNQVINPTKMPEVGTTIKFLKSNYVGLILEELNKQINR